MLETESQGRFNVRRDLSGRVRIELCGGIALVPPDIAAKIGVAILQMAGVEVHTINPGQTLIRPNGNGAIK